MKVQKLLQFIPNRELEFLASQTKVDYQVKKLDGISMFRLILYSMVTSNRASLRVMESFYSSATFRSLAGTGGRKTKYNSIRDRIVRMNPEFFEKIFFTLFDRFSSCLGEKKSILRFDSTMVAISAKLISNGMRVGSKTDKKQLKFTIGLKGSLPCHLSVFDTQSALSEDKTIPVAVHQSKYSRNSIVVFDRGVQERRAFFRMDEDEIQFITRINTSAAYQIISEKRVPVASMHATLLLKKDLVVRLKTSPSRKWSNQPLRLIQGELKADMTDIWFLTNIQDLSPYDIAAKYKERWDIEVFFKFLKQELNLEHLVTRNENGVRVMLYMTLITSILLVAYKKMNKLKGYKIPKLKFSLGLENEMMKEIVILCGGNPHKAHHLFSDS